MRQENPSEIVLHSNSTWIIIGAVFFGVTGIFLAYSGQWFGWISMATSLACFVLLFWMIRSPNSRLYLSTRGFRFGSLRRVSTYRWSDIDRFFPRRVANIERVCFTFSEQYQGEARLRQINQNFGGFDRFLTDY